MTAAAGLENQFGRELQAGIRQEASDVTVIFTGAVYLLLVDHDPLQKAFLDEDMQAAKDKEVFKFSVQGFMDFFRSTGAEAVDHFQQLQFLVGYADIISCAVHRMLYVNTPLSGDGYSIRRNHSSLSCIEGELIR